MIWNGDTIEQEIIEFFAPRVEHAGMYLRDYVHDRLGVQGSVVPFIASSPSEYPYRWGPELQDSIQYMQGETPLQAVVLSDAVDEHLNVGHHFSADEEFGHWWDGWAYDFATGKIVKVAPSHDVEARPFLRRGLAEAQDTVFDIIVGRIST